MCGWRLLHQTADVFIQNRNKVNIILTNAIQHVGLEHGHQNVVVCVVERDGPGARPAYSKSMGQIDV